MELHYKEYGDPNAPLMVFLHGGGVSGWMWDQQVQFFKHYHCLVPDLPEHGLHTNNNILFSIKGSAEEIIRLIEQKAGDKKVIVIGFSLGAQVLVQMLSMRSNLIDYGVINSALVRPMSMSKKWIQPMLKLSFPLIKNRWFSKQQARALFIGEADFERYFVESSKIQLNSLVRIMEENMSFTIPEDFHKAKGKILVTIGEKEKSMMLHSAKDLVEANEHCKGVILLGMGHGAPLAEPDFFNLIIEAWINERELPKGKWKEL